MIGHTTIQLAEQVFCHVLCPNNPKTVEIGSKDGEMLLAGTATSRLGATSTSLDGRALDLLRRAEGKG